MKKDKKICTKDLSIASNNSALNLPTISAGEYAEVLSVYIDNAGNKAVIPQGWTVSKVPRENIIWGKDVGLVIYNIPKEEVRGINWKKINKIMKKYDQLVWNPVNMLSATYTRDGIHFNEKFGRMNYRNEKFSESEYNELIVEELKKSVDKYGGYYVSRYKISRDKKTGRPRSVKGAYPWSKIDFPTAENVASIFFSNSKNLKSHLTYGAEYDTRVKWVIETGTVIKKDIISNSIRLGNYFDNNNYPRKIVKTGKDGCINNIYGFAGNTSEWTQEQNKNLYRVIRGGSVYFFGNDFTVAERICGDQYTRYYDVGFRATLFIISGTENF